MPLGSSIATKVLKTPDASTSVVSRVTLNVFVGMVSVLPLIEPVPRCQSAYAAPTAVLLLPAAKVFAYM